MKKYTASILLALLILLLGYFLIMVYQKNKEVRTLTVTKADHISVQNINNGTSTSPETKANIKAATSDAQAKITYFDICKEKAKKYNQFYLINDKECRLLEYGDFKTLEAYDEAFKNYETLYKAEFNSKINSSLRSEIVDIQSVYKKDNRYYVQFNSSQRIGMYDACNEGKGKEFVKKDIFGNQATFICDGEQYQVVKEFPLVTLELADTAGINFMADYSSARSEIFFLTPDEYVDLWPKYSINGQSDMRIYIDGNTITGAVQLFTQ
jgi:hypothetical protein